VDTRPIRSELTAIEIEVDRAVEAICKVGTSPALERKLKALEQRQRDLQDQIRAADATVVLPDRKVIAARWTAVVEGLGETPKRMTPSEIVCARAVLKARIGEIRVDRNGKGHGAIELGAALSANVVAGVGFEPTTFGL
jgi:hypothetical protein